MIKKTLYITQTNNPYNEKYIDYLKKKKISYEYIDLNKFPEPTEMARKYGIKMFLPIVIQIDEQEKETRYSYPRLVKKYGV